VRHRPVPADALVAIDAARYSVPVAYVGTTVAVHETPTHYELFHDGQCIARHAKAARHAVAMEPAHYAGLLRLRPELSAGRRPQWDLAYQPFGTVAVRDLALYERLATTEGAQP
jgi:hypothetical protein